MTREEKEIFVKMKDEMIRLGGFWVCGASRPIRTKSGERFKSSEWLAEMLMKHGNEFRDWIEDRV